MRWLIGLGVTASRGALAYAVLALSYSVTVLLCRLRPARPHRGWAPTGRIAIIGTFHNPNWFLSHVTPLSRCGADEVLVVTEQALEAPEKVKVLCPPAWLIRCLGRALAKLAWLFVCSVRFKPDLFIGYHIFPGSLTALIVARLFDRPACYQMTGGPAEIKDGGYGGNNDNPLMRRLARPSRLLERLAVAVVREFDLVVVRGSKARAFLAERGVTRRVEIITGSVAVDAERLQTPRHYDLVYVGQVIERKQPLDFIAVTAAVRRSIPTVRAALVGEGPLVDRVRRRASQLQLDECIEMLGKRRDVADILARSRIFVLTSRHEGLSIALIEAMAAGAVPVVPDVGDLADVVKNGVNGYLVTPGDIAEYVARILTLLRDPDLWARQSRAAVDTALRHSGVDVVTAKWDLSLRDVVARFAQPACYPERCESWDRTVSVVVGEPRNRAPRDGRAVEVEEADHPGPRASR